MHIETSVYFQSLCSMHIETVCYVKELQALD